MAQKLLTNHNGDNPGSSGKLMLNLFPVDKDTLTALKKGGDNPYLALTLNTRKKVASVTEHLSCKWGGSSIARGILSLFPYDIEAWKCQPIDADATIGDLYEVMGRPSKFQMRYGWIAHPELNTREASPLCDDGAQQTMMKSNDKHGREEAGQSSPLVNMNEAHCSDTSPQVDRARPGAAFSDLSSEVHASYTEDNSNHTTHVEGRLQLTAHSSIFDADETCHAFDSDQFPVLDSFSHNRSQADGLHTLTGDNKEGNTPPTMISPILSTDEGSLGLTGIYWNESMGPFDLGIPPGHRLSCFCSPTQ